MTSMIIVGCGGHALSCLDVILHSNKYRAVGYVDVENRGNWEGLSYWGTDADADRILKECKNIFIGVGQIKNSKLRRNLAEKWKSLGAEFPTVISSKAYVASTAVISPGSIVMHGAHIGPRAKIGEFNILNTHSIIEHGAKTGDFVHVSTGAIVNGDVQIGDNCFIGSQSVLCQGIDVPSGSFVQAAHFIGNKHVWG